MYQDVYYICRVIVCIIQLIKRSCLPYYLVSSCDVSRYLDSAKRGYFRGHFIVSLNELGLHLTVKKPSYRGISKKNLHFSLETLVSRVCFSPLNLSYGSGLSLQKQG